MLEVLIRKKKPERSKEWMQRHAWYINEADPSRERELTLKAGTIGFIRKALEKEAREAKRRMEDKENELGTAIINEAKNTEQKEQQFRTAMAQYLEAQEALTDFMNAKFRV